MELCENCAFRAQMEDGSFTCAISGKKVLTYQYACLKWRNKALYQQEQEEERLRKAKEIEAKQKALLAKENRKCNVILTLVINSLQAALLYLEDYESRVDLIGKGRGWCNEKKRSINQMLKAADAIRKNFYSVFEPDILRAISAKGGAEQTARLYDENAEDVNEMCRFVMLYVDKCYGSMENLKKLKDTLNAMTPFVQVFEDEDYKKYILK